MRSFLLILTAFPLASVALAVDRVDYEVEGFANENGTTSNMYWLQDRYEGDTFFEYAEAYIFSSPRVLSLRQRMGFFFRP